MLKNADFSVGQDIRNWLPLDCKQAELFGGLSGNIHQG